MKPFDLGRLLLKGLMQAHVTQKAVATYVMNELHWAPLVIEIVNDHVHITTEDSLQQLLTQVCDIIWQAEEYTVQAEELPVSSVCQRLWIPSSRMVASEIVEPSG